MTWCIFWYIRDGTRNRPIFNVFRTFVVSLFSYARSVNRDASASDDWKQQKNYQFPFSFCRLCPPTHTRTHPIKCAQDILFSIICYKVRSSHGTRSSSLYHYTNAPATTRVYIIPRRVPRRGKLPLELNFFLIWILVNIDHNVTSLFRARTLVWCRYFLCITQRFSQI